jgi:hypothetical protein
MGTVASRTVLTSPASSLDDTRGVNPLSLGISLRKPGCPATCLRFWGTLGLIRSSRPVPLELVRSQPVTQKNRGATQKDVLRESVRGYKGYCLSQAETCVSESAGGTQSKGRLSVPMQDMLRGPVLAPP